MVLGDRYGTACAPVLIDGFEAAFRARGFRVVRNKPYAGGFTTQRYGRPSVGRHALQIEVNRALYMDQERIVRSPGFERLKGNLTSLIDAVVDFPALRGELIARLATADPVDRDAVAKRRTIYMG